MLLLQIGDTTARLSENGKCSTALNLTYTLPMFAFAVQVRPEDVVISGDYGQCHERAVLPAEVLPVPRRSTTPFVT